MRKAVEDRHCDVIERYPGIYLQSAKNQENPFRIASITRHRASAVNSLPLRSPVTLSAVFKVNKICAYDVFINCRPTASAPPLMAPFKDTMAITG